MTSPTSRPLLCATDMVRAILEGRKTKTRRVIKDAAGPFWDHAGYRPTFVPIPDKQDRPVMGFQHKITNEIAKYGPTRPCPYGGAGDYLWVRETWFPDPPYDDTWDAYMFDDGSGIVNMDALPEKFRKPEFVIYRASWNGVALRWRPSIFMPRWASRLTLEILSIRMERLQAISDDDAQAEGFADVEHFSAYWNMLNTRRGYPWASNPWVWDIEFKKIAP